MTDLLISIVALAVVVACLILICKTSESIGRNKAICKISARSVELKIPPALVLALLWPDVYPDLGDEAVKKINERSDWY